MVENAAGAGRLTRDFRCKKKKKTQKTPKNKKQNSVGRNIIHGSDAVEAAQREIALWFPEGLAEYTPHMAKWIYE